MCDSPDEFSDSLSDLAELLKFNTQGYTYSDDSTRVQVTAELIKSLLSLNIGLIFGAPTLILGSLYDENPPNENITIGNTTDLPRMNDDQASWFGSIPFICIPLASFASGFLQEKYGRIGTLIRVTIPSFAVWILLYFANSIRALYVGAVFMGLSVGLQAAPSVSYTGEMSEPRLRGTLNIIGSVAVSVGIFIMFTLGYFFDWRTAALISSTLPVITFALLTKIPESPVWLIERNRLEDAKKSLCWLRGCTSTDEVEEEFDDLITYTINSAKEMRTETSKLTRESPYFNNGGFLMTNLSLLTSKKVLRPLRLAMTTFLISYISTLGGMRPYFIGELNDLHTPVDAKLILILFQVMFLAGAVINMASLRHFGKRRIALFSHGIAAASILGIGAYSRYLEDLTSYPNLNWLPPFLLLVINFLSGLSMLILPWQLVCEVFPPAARGPATGVAAAWEHLMLSAMIKSYLFIKAWIGFSGVMYLYGAGASLGLLYHYQYLPETEGKSLERIETYFTQNHNRLEKFSFSKSPSAGTLIWRHSRNQEYGSILH